MGKYLFGLKHFPSQDKQGNIRTLFSSGQKIYFLIHKISQLLKDPEPLFNYIKTLPTLTEQLLLSSFNKQIVWNTKNLSSLLLQQQYNFFLQLNDIGKKSKL